VPGRGDPDVVQHHCPQRNWHRRGGIILTQVVVDKNESFEAALKRFNKKVQEDRILSEVRRRRFFEKPSVERKKKKAAKRRKSLKETMRNEDRD
jgi:small subunit ribosomal protein S21